MTSTPSTDEPLDDDAALHWAGDDERGAAPRRLTGASTRRESALEGRDETMTPDADEAPAASTAPSSPARAAATVLFALVYLAIVLGWVLSVQRTTSGSGELVIELSWQFGEFLAMLSGALWFGAVHSLTRGSRTLVRVGWWALGAAVLVPWPLVLVILAEASA